MYPSPANYRVCNSSIPSWSGRDQPPNTFLCILALKRQLSAPNRNHIKNSKKSDKEIFIYYQNGGVRAKRRKNSDKSATARVGTHAFKTSGL